jgi:hypothetical protein
VAPTTPPLVSVGCICCGCQTSNGCGRQKLGVLTCNAKTSGTDAGAVSERVANQQEVVLVEGSVQSSNCCWCFAGKDCGTLAPLAGVNASSCTAPTTQCLAVQNLSTSAYPPNLSGAVSFTYNCIVLSVQVLFRLTCDLFMIRVLCQRFSIVVLLVRACTVKHPNCALLTCCFIASAGCAWFACSEVFHCRSPMLYLRSSLCHLRHLEPQHAALPGCQLHCLYA